MVVVSTDLLGALEGMDTLPHPVVRMDNESAGVPFKVLWGGPLDLQKCSLQNCTYPVLNPSGVFISARVLFVVASAFHGFGTVNEAPYPSMGTVSGAWGPSFQALVVGFFDVDPTTHRVTHIPGSTQRLPACTEDVPCLYEGDRNIDPRISRMDDGDDTLLLTHTVFMEGFHTMAYQCLKADPRTLKVTRVSCQTGLPMQRGLHKICPDFKGSPLFPRHHQKNWAFFSSTEPRTSPNDTVLEPTLRKYFVYEFMPKFTVVRFDPRENSCEIANVGPPGGVLDNTEHVPLNDFVTHAVAHRMRQLLEPHALQRAYPPHFSESAIEEEQALLRKWLGGRQNASRGENRLHLRSVSNLQTAVAADDCTSRACSSRRFLAVVRGGSPGVPFGDNGTATLFLAHATFKKHLLPFAAHAAEAEQDNDICALYGRWEKNEEDSRVFDHCAYLATYPSVYAMMFVVVDSVKRASADRQADEPEAAFGISHLSSVFFPPNRYRNGSKIAFPSGISATAGGYHVTYGEDDRFANSFFMSSEEVRALLFEPRVEHAPLLVAEPLDLRRKMINVRAQAPPPLAVLVLGHEQGTFWFFDVLKGMIKGGGGAARGNRGYALSLCGPPARNRLFPDSARGGLWRWRASDAFERYVSTWQDGHVPGSREALEPCLHFSPQAALATEPPTGLGKTQQAIVAYDLWGKDLLALVAACAPALASEIMERPELQKMGSTHLSHWQAASRVCSLSGPQPFSLVRTVRDPRDVVTYGYRYHKSCPPNEPWLHAEGNVAADIRRRQSVLKLTLGDDFDVSWFATQSWNVSYCQLLNQVSERVGLALEIVVASCRWLAGLQTFMQVLSAAPELTQFVHLVKYEDLWSQPEPALSEAGARLFGAGGGVSRWARDAFADQGARLRQPNWPQARDAASRVLQEAPHEQQPHQHPEDELQAQPRAAAGRYAERWSDAARAALDDGGRLSPDGGRLSLEETRGGAAEGMRGGAPGAWKAVFGAEHLQLLEMTGLGSIVRKLGHKGKGGAHAASASDDGGGHLAV